MRPHADGIPPQFAWPTLIYSARNLRGFVLFVSLTQVYCSRPAPSVESRTKNRWSDGHQHIHTQTHTFDKALRKPQGVRFSINTREQLGPNSLNIEGLLHGCRPPNKLPTKYAENGFCCLVVGGGCSASAVLVHRTPAAAHT